MWLRGGKLARQMARRATVCRMNRIREAVVAAVALFFLAGAGAAQGKRYVLIGQDAAGPGGTDMMSILVLLQSPQVQTLGITVVTGDQWRDEEVDMMSILGRLQQHQVQTLGI